MKYSTDRQRLDKNIADAYEDLANAIIIKAVDDYRSLLKKIKKSNTRILKTDNPDVINTEKAKIVGYEYSIKALDKFFLSGYFIGLSKVDGHYIIERLKTEIK